MKTTTTEVIIIGGGLAGLCASIHLAKKGRKVVLIEKNEYPRHKVCGEYVSNEVLPYLNYLGFNPFAHGAKKIKEFELSTRNGKRIATQLPLGGFGISRFQLDYELYQLSKSHGVRFVKDRVQYLNYTDNSFSVATKSSGSFYSKLVIGAFGKRSNLDMAMQRKFVKKKSPYLAVKMHSSGDFPDDKVALHNFKGGYCGVSKVENDHINLCYISSFKAFQPYKDISRFQGEGAF
jgi:flavin-dependent dehydrogenase